MLRRQRRPDPLADEGACAGIGLQERAEGAAGGVSSRLHSSFHEARNLGEADPAIEKRFDGDLVGGVEGGGDGAAGVHRGVRQRQRGEGLGVGGGEVERAQRGPVEAGVRRRPAFGERERVLDGHAHIGHADLRLRRAVHELHDGVDDGLRVDDDGDLVGPEPVEPARLDDLQRLVHHRRGVDGDAGAHAPVRVVQRLLGRDGVECGGVAVTEGSAAGGEHDALDGLGRLADQALEERRVFGVDGQHARARGAAGVAHEGARHDEGFFGGERHVGPGAERRERRRQPRGADDGGDDEVGLWRGRQLGEGLLPRPHFDPGPREGLRQRRICRRVGDDDALGADLACLLRQQPPVAARREGADANPLGMQRRHLQRLRPDGPGGAEHDHVARAVVGSGSRVAEVGDHRVRRQ